MKNFVKKIGVLNIIIAVIIVVSWCNVLLIHGQAGAFFWDALIIAYPIMGVLGLVVSFIIMIRRSIKKKSRNIGRSIVLCLLCLILIFPALFFLGIVPFGYPSKVENTSPSITVEWPLKENTVVGWGGDSIEDNYHAIWSGERWAYDLLMEPYEVGSDSSEDYGIWNKEVFSPVSGTVVGAFDDEADIPPNTEEFLSAEGNYVFIQIDETKTYLLLCHLKQDSVEVQVGDYVEIGDYLGRVGNSGSTSEPHLHIHHQRHDPTKTHVMLAEGLPLYFKKDGDKFMPVKGDVIKLKDQ